MIKKIKFPLKLKDDFPVRSLEELKAHFDIHKITGYYLDGKLLTWLNDRNYTAEANAIGALQRDDTDLQRKFLEIFDVKDSVSDSTVDISVIEQRNKKIAILRQYASDENILNHPEQVALNQDDLDKLIADDKFNEIYLCNNSFVIKLANKKHYIGIGKVVATVEYPPVSDFEGVSFSNVELDAQSMVNIGCAYGYNAQNTQEDFFNAMAWWQKAVDLGKMAAALRNMGIFYLEGKGVPQDKHKGFELVKQSAENGSSPYSKYCLGDLYRYGNGVTKDGYKAIEWYKKAIDVGYKDALFDIGYMYDVGDGVQQNAYKAIEWYKKAAELGDTCAASNIALIYKKGNGVPQDVYKAIEWYKKTADLGDPQGFFEIAGLYDLSGLIEKDRVKALEWYKKAAAMGHANSVRRIGDFYQAGEEYGYCVPKDIHKALEWYEKAAALGSTFAMQNIANIYRSDAVYPDYYGKGILFSKNISEGCHKALEWYKKAAELGDTDAMYHIACDIYQYDAENNYGVFTDGYQKALEWYKKIIETSSDTTTFAFKEATKEIPKLEAILNTNK